MYIQDFGDTRKERLQLRYFNITTSSVLLFAGKNYASQTPFENVFKIDGQIEMKALLSYLSCHNFTTMSPIHVRRLSDSEQALRLSVQHVMVSNSTVDDMSKSNILHVRRLSGPVIPHVPCRRLVDIVHFQNMFRREFRPYVMSDVHKVEESRFETRIGEFATRRDVYRACFYRGISTANSKLKDLRAKLEEPPCVDKKEKMESVESTKETAEMNVVEKAAETTVVEKTTEMIVVEKAAETIVVEKTAEMIVVEKTAEMNVVEKAAEMFVVEKTAETIVVEKAAEMTVVEKTAEMIVVEKDDDDDDDDNKSRHSTTDRCSTTKRRKCLHVVVKNKPIQQEHFEEVSVRTSPIHYKSEGILSSSDSSQHALMGRWKPPDPPP